MRPTHRAFALSVLFTAAADSACSTQQTISPPQDTYEIHRNAVDQTYEIHATREACTKDGYLFTSRGIDAWIDYPQNPIHPITTENLANVRRAWAETLGQYGTAAFQTIIPTMPASEVRKHLTDGLPFGREAVTPEIENRIDELTATSRGTGKTHVEQIAAQNLGFSSEYVTVGTGHGPIGGGHAFTLSDKPSPRCAP